MTEGRAGTEEKKYCIKEDELHRRKSAIKRNTQRNAKHTSREGHGIEHCKSDQVYSSKGGKKCPIRTSDGDEKKKNFLWRIFFRSPCTVEETEPNLIYVLGDAKI